MRRLTPALTTCALVLTTLGTAGLTATGLVGSASAADADLPPGLARTLDRLVGTSPEVHRHGTEPSRQSAAEARAMAQRAVVGQDDRGNGERFDEGPLVMPTSYPTQPELTVFPDNPDDASDAGALWSHDELAPQLTTWMGESDRISTQVVGQSVQGRDLYLVTLTAPETVEETAQQTAWRELIRTDPAAAAADSALQAGYKTPIWFSGNVHGNEWEGTDAIMDTIGSLVESTGEATDALLAGHRLYFSLSLNPDGRTLGQRPGTLGLDINRDMIPSTTPEGVSFARTAHAVQALYAADLHGYTGVLQVEPCGPPHGDSYEYDLFIPHGYAIARQIEDEVLEAAIPGNPVVDTLTGLISQLEQVTGTGRITIPYRDPPSGWDDSPPVFTAQYAAYYGAVSSTVELPLPRSGATQNPATAAVNTAVGVQVIDSIVDYVTTNSDDMLANQIEIFRRGAAGEPKVQLTEANIADVPGPDEWKPLWDVADDQNPVAYPRAYVIPVGEQQRSRGDAAEVVRHLLFHGIEVGTLDEETTVGATTYPAGSYVVDMHQPLRGLAHALLDVGSDISEKVPSMYDVSAWSYTFLWGGTVDEVGATGDPAIGATTPVSDVTPAADAPTTGELAFPLSGGDEVRATLDMLEAGAAVSLLADGTAVVGGADRAAATAAAATWDVELTRATPAQVAALAEESTRGLSDLDVGYVGTQDDTLALGSLDLDLVPLTGADIDADPTVLDDLEVLWVGSSLSLSTEGESALQAWVDAGHGIVGRGSAGLAAASDRGLVSASASTGTSSSNGIVALDNPDGLPAGSPLAMHEQTSGFVYPATWFTDLGEGTLAARTYAAGAPLLAGHWTGTGQASAAGQAETIQGEAASGARGLVFGTSLVFRNHPKGGLGDLGRALLWAAPEGERAVADLPTTTTLSQRGTTAAGGRVRFEVDVAVTDGGAEGPVPTGRVSIREQVDGEPGEEVAEGRLVDGALDTAIDAPGVGEHEYVATYTPTGAFQVSTSDVLSVSIDRTTSRTRAGYRRPGRGRLEVRTTVTGDGVVPVGRVKVIVDGETVRTFRVRAKDFGKRTVTVRPGRGEHVVRVRFVGNDELKPSRTKKRTLRIR